MPVPARRRRADRELTPADLDVLRESHRYRVRLRRRESPPWLAKAKLMVAVAMNQDDVEAA